MGVAIVAAVAAVLVAFIREVGSRIERSDRRNTISKELEILDKLDTDSVEYDHLKKHVRRSVLLMVTLENAENARWKTRGRIEMVGAALIAIVLCLTYVRASVDVGGYKPAVDAAYYSGGVLVFLWGCAWFGYAVSMYRKPPPDTPKSETPPTA